MDRKEAKPYWQKGIFCIKLCKEVKNPKFQPVALGIDPGSKREAYTVATEKHVVLNITTNTKDWIMKHIENCRFLRRARRFRKTPYRKCKSNRSCLRNKKIPISTKTRWLTKINMIKYLFKITPISIINAEDIKAVSKIGKNNKWNKIFSPLQHGKIFFDEEILKLNIKIIKTQGYDTAKHRTLRNFIKDKNNKLNFNWEVHNVDSHALCEIALNKHIIPYKSLYKIEYLEYHRRKLHVQNPTKGNIRKQYGTTVSLGIPRGSVALCKDKLCYIGGTMSNKITVHSIITGARIYRNISKDKIRVLYKDNKRVQLLCLIKKDIPLFYL